MEKTKLNGHIIRRIILAAFCIFIAASVSVVMFKIYNPEQNALGALASVCMDIICIVILIILIVSLIFDNYNATKTTKMFAVLLVATIWAIFLDFLNWAFDGSLEFGHLTYWFTLGSLCMGAVLACIFSQYLYVYMKEAHELDNMKISARVCGILNVISFVLAFVLAITGTAFEFSDGHYETGALYDAVGVIPVLTLLYLTGFVICCIKKIGFHDVFSVIGYILFMIAGVIIESEFVIGTTYVAVAIADIFIFIMLQNELIAKEKRMVQEWMAKSNTDALTGFLNRNAYESDIKALMSNHIDEGLVYVSVDVNSLKMVNDSFGHNAGDELLVGAAQCLNKSFGLHGKLYRIGGDEFIAIIYVDDEKLEIIKKDLEKITADWSKDKGYTLALSCGYVPLKENDKLSINEMASLADKRMYEAKRDYYIRNGIDRRKR